VSAVQRIDYLSERRRSSNYDGLRAGGILIDYGTRQKGSIYGSSDSKV